ncbi:hypothetical protein QFZ70_003474 [Arthrobacter sp. V1I9]|nr:hypothetical protein [Arthrobacter sp. V1I9]
MDLRKELYLYTPCRFPPREETALRLIALSCFGLALFVTVGAIRALTGAQEAVHSPAGIVLAAASLVIMPFLSWAQRRAGRELESRSAVADSSGPWFRFARFFQGFRQRVSARSGRQDVRIWQGSLTPNDSIRSVRRAW